MKMTMQYIAVESPDLDGLTEKVQEKLDAGWRCQGGLCVFIHRALEDKELVERQVFMQAMLRDIPSAAD